jgi:hypothetical protein
MRVESGLLRLKRTYYEGKLFTFEGEIMRRPVLYIAGALMATGAAMAVAGPASAATSHQSCSVSNPFCWQQGQSFSNNPQWADQRAYTDQNALSNVGNPQFGLVNLNALNGGASNTASTGLLAGLLG